MYKNALQSSSFHTFPRILFKQSSKSPQLPSSTCQGLPCRIWQSWSWQIWPSVAVAQGCTLSQGAPLRAKICNTIFCREMTHHQKKVWIFWMKKIYRSVKSKFVKFETLWCDIQITHHFWYKIQSLNHHGAGQPPRSSPFFRWKLGSYCQAWTSTCSHEKMASHGKSIPQLKTPRLRAAAAVAFRQSLCVPRAQGAMNWQIFEDLCVCWWFLWVFLYVFWTNFLQDLPRKDLQRSFLTMLPLQDHLAVVRSSTVRVVSITKSFETYISKLQWGISVITRRGNRWQTLRWKSSVPMTPRLSTTQYYLVLQVLFYCNKCILSAYFYF